LRRLSLDNLDLASGPALDKYLDLASLQCLRLYNSCNIATVLRCLVSGWPQTSPLEGLEVILSAFSASRDSDEHAVDTLLNSVVAIKRLWLAGGTVRLGSTSGICRQGATLRHLELSATRACGQFLDVADLTTSLRSCSSLEGLAVDFCPVPLGNIQTL
jgi:hypothetical protein